MKLWKKLSLWVSFSIVLQLLFLWFINDIYLQRRGEVIEVTRYQEKDIRLVSRNLENSGNLTDISVSNECSFAAYITDGDLQIINLYGENDSKLISKNGAQIQCYKWLPDRNMVIYAFTEIMNGQKLINIETYDAETGIFRGYPYINQVDGADIYSIEASTLTNTVYVILKTNSQKSSIYKYDIVENLSYIADVDDIASVYHLIHTDGLVYQNSINRIFILDGNKKLKRIDTNLNGKSVLLGTDINGLIYIGKMDEQLRITEIVFGGIASFQENGVKRIKLEAPIVKENIKITSEGDIYCTSENGKSVFNVINGTFVEYPGEFIQVSGKYIVSVKDRKIRFTVLNLLH